METDFDTTIEIISEKIPLAHLQKKADERFGDMVKAVVDIDKKIMAIDGELHADEEAVLLESGSLQNNLWGINIYPGGKDEEFIEFDSMINIRPRQGNRSRGVENKGTQGQIREIVHLLIERV